MVNDADVAAAQAKYFNIPFVNLKEKASSPVALGYVDKKYSR